MPYASVDELPQAVKDKIKSPRRRRQWMHVWNSEYDKHGDESRAFASAWSTAQKGSSMSDFNLFLPLSKVERQRDGSVIVSGYCSTPTLDLDGEVVALDAIRKALPGYWAWRNIRQMHQASAVGVGKEANIDDKGCFLSAKITDKEAAQKCLDQVYKGFSIGGKKLAKTGNTITEIEWIETSIVDRPANPECKFDVAKRAKEGQGAYLVKLPKPAVDPKSKALGQMAKAVRALAKAGPPAAHDGFSLPAKVEKDGNDEEEACEEHGIVGCEKCKEAAAKRAKPANGGTDDADDAGATDTTKRDVSRKERKALARQGKALPGGGFPIKDKSDLDNARRAIGRAKNPGATRALIRRRARELGVELPPTWSKKLAKALVAQAVIERIAARGSAAPSFLTLSAEGDHRGTVAKGAGLGHGPTSTLVAVSEEDGIDGKSEKLLRKLERKRLAAVIGQKTDNSVDDLGFLNLGGLEMTTKVAKGASGRLTFDIDSVSDPIAKAVLEMVKRASAPSRMARMTMARGDLKKARKAAGSMEDCIKAAHAMHKSAYLAKAANGGKKKPDDNDADDFDHQGAMEKLQKAYSDLTTLKTLIKSAGGQLKKAMSRSGQRGQEVSDGTEDYKVPEGVKDLSPSDVDTAGGSSPPFVHGMETPFPGKSAKTNLAKFVKDGKIPVEIAELLAERAALEGQVEALGKLPAGPVFGKKPSAFDMTKIVGGTKDDPTAAIIMKGVDPADLTKDEASNAKAISKMIGNMIIGGAGKSVFDNDFHGTGGLGG
jgi:hypothetical protein